MVNPETLVNGQTLGFGSNSQSCSECPGGYGCGFWSIRHFWSDAPTLGLTLRGVSARPPGSPAECGCWAAGATVLLGPPCTSVNPGNGGETPGRGVREVRGAEAACSRGRGVGAGIRPWPDEGSDAGWGPATGLIAVGPVPPESPPHRLSNKPCGVASSQAWTTQRPFLCAVLLDLAVFRGPSGRMPMVGGVAGLPLSPDQACRTALGT